jgi:hypothetical protein
MPHIDQLFPSPYLAASDLAGEVHCVTIDRVTIAEIGPRKDRKPILHVREFGKPIVLNRTNGRAIAEVVGSPDTDHWLGRQILIFPTDVEFAGRVVPAIRVKQQAPLPQAPVPQPPILAPPTAVPPTVPQPVPVQQAVPPTGSPGRSLSAILGDARRS